MRLERFRQPLRLLGQRFTYSPAGAVRSLHKTRPPHEIPQPRPFVPDVSTFLTLIGRGLNKHASKFPSWESMWSMTGPQLQELGIEPARSRKYLLDWMQRYRRGDFGPGGDFHYVKDGQAQLKVALTPAWPHAHKIVVNVPFEQQAIKAETEGETAAETSEAAATAQDGAEGQQVEAQQVEAVEVEKPTSYPRPRLYTVKGLRSIAGPFATPLSGHQGAVVKVTEGMWEHKQGRKIDGGERRRAEVRFKRRSAERRAEREAEILANM
ncbi:IGR protein motif domain-containing protein [Sarocladium implicatum]|nr:IGR protein motif domain-containing protein [Sarocladium implicatum]